MNFVKMLLLHSINVIHFTRRTHYKITLKEIMAKSKSIFGDDPRTPKLLGVLLVFLSAYLFIACTSYIFTWKDDQDKVWHFNFDLLFQDIEVANLLRFFDVHAFRLAVFFHHLLAVSIRFGHHQ
jgi:hypothetical protein